MRGLLFFYEYWPVEVPHHGDLLESWRCPRYVGVISRATIVGKDFIEAALFAGLLELCCPGGVPPV